MKSSICLMTLLFLVSCAQAPSTRKITEASWDALGDEAFLRWGSERISRELKKDEVVSNCYQGKATETLEEYKVDYTEKVKAPYYWLHIGNCFFSKGSYSKAEFFYRMSADESKGKAVKAVALNNLALIYFKYEDWEKGKAYLKEAITAGPSNKVPRFNLSQLYLQFGHYDRSIALLNDPVFKNTQDVDVYFSLANAYLYKGDLKKSYSYFKEIPANFLKRDDIASTYALYLIRIGDFKGAEKVMDERDKSSAPEMVIISSKIESILSQRMKEE